MENQSYQIKSAFNFYNHDMIKNLKPTQNQKVAKNRNRSLEPHRLDEIGLKYYYSHSKNWRYHSFLIQIFWNCMPTHNSCFSKKGIFSKDFFAL